MEKLATLFDYMKVKMIDRNNVFTKVLDTAKTFLLSCKLLKAILLKEF